MGNRVGKAERKEEEPQATMACSSEVLSFWCVKKAMAGGWGAFERDSGACGVFERLTEAGLVLHILSWLELEHLFRIRLVCKSWYDAVLSPHFVRLFMERHQLDPWIFLKVRTEKPAARRPSFAYDLDVVDDYFDLHMKLASHQEVWRPYTSTRRQKSSFPLAPGSPFVGLCASNGLVCGRLMDERQSLTLAVGNPFTNRWKKLPPAPIAYKNVITTPYLSVVMETNPNTGCYMIVVCYMHLILMEGHAPGSELDPTDYMVQYDSAAGVWETGTSFDGTASSLSSRQGSFIFMEVIDQAKGVVGYDPVCKQWWHVDVRQPVYQGSEVFRLGAFMYKGKCVWVAALEGGGEEMGAAVWELDEKRRCWTLLSKVLWRELFGNDWCLIFEPVMDQRVMQVVGDTVVISSYYGRESYGSWAPVAYDLVSSRWYTCVKPEEFGKHLGESCLPFDMECSYAVVPSLTAQP